MFHDFNSEKLADELSKSLSLIKEVFSHFLIYKSLSQSRGNFSIEAFEKTLLEMPIEKHFSEMVENFLLDEGFFSFEFWAKSIRKEILENPELPKVLNESYAVFEAYKKSIMQ